MSSDRKIETHELNLLSWEFEKQIQIAFSPESSGLWHVNRLSGSAEAVVDKKTIKQFALTLLI